MGYTTEFKGSFLFNEQPDETFVDYINSFSYTRRVKRDVDKIKEIYKDWREYSYNGDLGIDGEYFVKDTDFNSCELFDKSIVEYNTPPETQPGLWCQWVITRDNDGIYKLEWDGGEKFYNYIEWLKYLINNFIKPLGYEISGEVYWRGEDFDDFGVIFVVNNNIFVHEIKRR